MAGHEASQCCEAGAPLGHVLSADGLSVSPGGFRHRGRGAGEAWKTGHDVASVGDCLLLRTLFLSLGCWAFLWL